METLFALLEGLRTEIRKLRYVWLVCTIWCIGVNILYFVGLTYKFIQHDLSGYLVYELLPTLILGILAYYSFRIKIKQLQTL